MVAVSGGLHMDGLADTADGFLSNRPKGRILEIMKDSRSRPMGVIALTGVLLLKAAALSSVGGASRWGVVFLMPFAGRCALVMEMAMFSYARPEGGLVSAFSKPRLAWTSPMLLIAISWLLLLNLGLTLADFSVLPSRFSSWCSEKGDLPETLSAPMELSK
jgi:adenosylcobinamide-GDP ribazoletransferase